MRPFDLEIEPPLQIAKVQEVALLRQALSANPTSRTLRERLAILLFIQDQFDEAIALFETLSHEAPTSKCAWYLAEAYISRETQDDDRRSEHAARRALTLAGDRYERSRALAALGKALTRQGQTAAAREALVAALDDNPHDTNAYKRLAALDLKSDALHDILETADALLAQGVGHSRLMIARALAFARLGRMAEARDAVGLDRFLCRQTLTPPPGWESIAALNDDVKAELARHPDLRFNRYGSASHETWRVDEPSFANSVAIPALQKLIRQAVTDHVQALDAHDTPWTNVRPDRAVLHNWCVLTDAEGFEEWHVHQSGWLSGVYYIDVPATVIAGDDTSGCIAFGLPEDLVGDECARAFGQTLVRPQAGLLMLFPSHSYHRTFAHGSDQRRICLAFDIKPA